VRLKSRDPHEHPAILFNYMSSEQDWQEFRDAIRITREIMHQPALDNIAAAKSARDRVPERCRAG
jgi:choline dehydrogenase